MEKIEKSSMALQRWKLLLILLAILAGNLIQISVPLVAKAGTVSKYIYFGSTSQSGAGYQWEYSNGSGVLTLSGVTFEQGICFEVPATIELTEGTENIVYGPSYVLSSHHMGIYTSYELSIVGNGELTVYSCGQEEMKSSDACTKNTYGIYFNNEYKSFTIGNGSDNPILNIETKETEETTYGYSYGIYASSKSFTINSGTITSKAKGSKGYSVGISSENTFGTSELIINGGTIKATAENAKSLSIGLWANNVYINGGTIDLETGNTTDTSYTTDSCGICSNGIMEINAGTINIKTGNQGDNKKLKRYALYAEKYITLSDDLKMENCEDLDKFVSGTTTQLIPLDGNEYFKIKSKYHQINFDENMQPKTVGFTINSEIKWIEDIKNSVKMESGDTVHMWVSYYPTEGFNLKELKVTDGSGNEIALEVEQDRYEYSFTMPESDVTIKADYDTYEFAEDYSGIYDGQPHSITIRNIPSGVEVTYSENGEDYSTTNPTYTDVVYQKKVYYKVGSENYGYWTGSALVTIKPADVTYTAPQAVTGLLYNGSPQTLIQAGTAQNGTVYYRMGSSGTWENTVPTATETGSYTIYYYVKADNSNYQDSGSTSKPIGKIEATIGEKIEEEEDAKKETEDTGENETPGDEKKEEEATDKEEEAAKKDEEEAEVEDTVGDETSDDVTAEKIADNTTTDVEVKENTPAVTVEGLENIFETVENQQQSIITAEEADIVKNGGNINVKLVAEAKDEKMDNALDIAEKASQEKKTIGMYLDLSVIKNVTDVNGNEYSNAKLIELPSTIAIHIPLDSTQQGKENYVVYRYHEDDVDVIDFTANQADEYLELVNEKTELVLHVKKFSIYAVAYDKKRSGGAPLVTPSLIGQETREESEKQEETQNVTEEQKVSTAQTTIENQVEVTAGKVQDTVEPYDTSQDELLATVSTITAEKNDTDIKGSDYELLQARASETTANSVKLIWNKVKGADGYLIYGNQCNTGGKKYSFKLIRTIKNGNTKSYTQKKLKEGTYYKYIVCAYQVVDGKKVNLAVSKTIYAAAGKNANVTSLKLNKTKVTLKVGKTFKLKASEVKESKNIKKYRGISFESGNQLVATVSKKGVIKAVKKGKCTIYVYAQNGVCKKVKVTVK